jgi:hypothetical protein
MASVEAINHEMQYPADIPVESVDRAVEFIMDRLREAHVRGMAGEVFSVRAIVGEALRSAIPTSNQRWAVLNALDGLEEALAEAERDREPAWIAPSDVRIYLHGMREALQP